MLHDWQSIHDKCVELLSKFPKDYQEIEYKQQIQKQGGLSVPLNICLFQEVQRLQIVIERIRSDLENLRLAIKGEVVMTPALQSALDAMYDANSLDLAILKKKKSKRCCLPLQCRWRVRAAQVSFRVRNDGAHRRIHRRI